MKVYVAVWGMYSSQGVVGVYDTVERAIAANHQPGWKWKRSESLYPGGRRFVTWENDQDWESAVSIEPFELESEGPERAVDTAEFVDYAQDPKRVIRSEMPA